MTSKVFVGNLAFQTTDQALAEAFQDCGKVKTGVVITRGRRSLGYGFVEFESHESALEAVKSKNNIELKGRNLKVELASDNPVRPLQPGGPGERSPAGGVAPSSQQTGGNPSGQPSDNNAGGGGGPRNRPRRNFNRGRKNPSGGPRKPGGVKTTVVDNTQNPNPNPKNNNQTGGNNPSVGGGSNPGAGGKGPNTGAGGNQPRGPRQPRAPRNKRPPQERNFPPVENRVLSKTAVFVANLPFNVKDDELLNFFKDNNPKSAHVVQTRTGRSRGYGFVDFDTENDQQGAILTKNNLVFPSSDRQITVTASYKTPEVAAT